MAKLKKGSAAAKAWGRRMKRLRKGSYSTNSNSVTKLKKRTMAKRRTKKRSKKQKSSILGINTAKATAAVLYGAIRAKTSQFLSPYTSKIPLGSISDEVGMIAASWAGKKFLFKGSGVLRDALTIGQTIELARIGDAAISGQIGLGFLGGTATTTGTNIF